MTIQEASHCKNGLLSHCQAMATCPVIAAWVCGVSMPPEVHFRGPLCVTIGYFFVFCNIRIALALIDCQANFE